MLLKDALLELPQRDTRLDTDLVDQHVTSSPEGPQGIRLPSRAVQRQHQLRPNPLTERVGHHRLLELGHDQLMATRFDQRIHTVLTRDRSHLVEAVALKHREVDVRELAQGRTAPQVQSLLQHRQRFLVTTVEEGGRAIVSELLEANDIDVLWRGREDVAAIDGLQGRGIVTRGQRPPQLRNQDVHSVEGRPAVRPERIDDLVARHDFTVPRGEQGHQRAQPQAA